MKYPHRPSKPTPIEDVPAGSLITREGATWRVESNEATPGRPAYRTLTLRGNRVRVPKGPSLTAPTGPLVTVYTN